MQKCKQCEWEFPDDIRICPYCGHPVEPEDQKQKRRFKLRWHPGTLPQGPKGRPSGLAPSTAHPLAIALITAILLASLIAGLVLVPLLGGHPQTPPPILILRGIIVPGGNISVQGHNFTPGGTVTFTIDGHTATIASSSSTAQHLPGTVSLALMSLSLSQLAPQTTKDRSGGTSVPVKSDGTFEAKIQVDPHWPVGSSHLLVATEQSRGQQAHVTIIVPRQAELVSCSHSTATTDISLGPVPADQKQPVSTVFTLCTIGSGIVQWTANWGQRQAKWLQLDRTGQIQAPLSKQITISALAGSLKAGTYTATITFSDQNSPTKISLRVMFIVRSAPATACLNTSAASLSFTATQGQANPSPQSVKLSNCGNPGSWSATASTADGGNWLSMSPASGQLKGQSSFDILVAISSSRLGQGIYTGQVTFKIGTGMAVVNVLLTVQPSEQNPPCISAAPQSLSFSTTQQGQGNPASQVATIGNCGPAGSWSATVSTADGGNWLNINPATGNLTANATQEVSITASSANLQKGAYTGLVTFKMGSSMATVDVAFTILRQQQKSCLAVNTPSLPFTAIQGQSDPAPQTVTLTNCGPFGSWSASTANSSGWLGISPSSNALSAGATQNVTVNVSVSGLSAAQYSDTITFTISTDSGTAQVNLTVTLIVQPPLPCLQITEVNRQQPSSSPNVSISMYPGTSSTITVRNCGSDNGTLSAGISNSDGGNWLGTDLQPNTPLESGAMQTVTITTSTSAPYKATGTVTLTITTSTGSNSAQVSVALSIIPPPPVQRQISSTQTQSQTVKATGTGQDPATHATGTLTFYNLRADYSFIVPAGQIWTGTDGIQVMNDASVCLNPVTYGSLTVGYSVPAHTLQTGTAANIVVGDVDLIWDISPFASKSTCSSTSNAHSSAIYALTVPLSGYQEVRNEKAFTSGQDAQTYTFVQQSDIDGAFTSLQNSTQQSAINDIQQQLQPNEHLVGNPQCTSNVSSDHNTGDRVSLVTVTAITTCKATAST